MIPYWIDREKASLRASSVTCGLTKRRVVDYCRLAAAL
jgi:hypothetical protein